MATGCFFRVLNGGSLVPHPGEVGVGTVWARCGDIGRSVVGNWLRTSCISLWTLDISGADFRPGIFRIPPDFQL